MGQARANLTRGDKIIPVLDSQDPTDLASFPVRALVDHYGPRVSSRGVQKPFCMRKLPVTRPKELKYEVPHAWHVPTVDSVHVWDRHSNSYFTNIFFDLQSIFDIQLQATVHSFHETWK